jgi:hypothetical protein
MSVTTQIDPAAHDQLSRTDHRTLAALFAHPLSHNLSWADAVSLFNSIGAVEQKSNHEVIFRAAGQSHVMQQPHSKHLTAPELMGLRHFATSVGWSPDRTPQPTLHHHPDSPTLLVVIDHHEARIFHADVSTATPGEDTIRPYDPHHFLHHLHHKDQPRERGQRSPEDATYYGRIAAAVAAGGPIMVVGHGTGESNAAHHLTEYLRQHHPETYDRVVRTLVEDIGSLTEPQLLALARGAWRPREK